MTETWDLGCIQNGSEEQKECKHKLMGMYAELRILQRGEVDRGGQDRLTDLLKWHGASRSRSAVLMTSSVHGMHGRQGCCQLSASVSSLLD